MFFYPVEYDQPLFRPPAEANSVIIQATIGCSWNKCAFCEMYTSKSFKVRNLPDIKNEISNLSNCFPETKRFFLADGNAFILSKNKLLRIINEIKKSFGSVQRISAYALPSDILSKTLSELSEIKNAGLKLLYIGIESGDDELLKLVNKNETYESTIEGIQKAHEVGIDTSIMIINGLGGTKYSEQHAINSAKIINKLNPKYLSILTLSFPLGKKHFYKRFNDEYIDMNSKDLLNELKLFIENTTIENSIFRTDHISNNLVLKGVLSKNKKKILDKISKAMEFNIEHNRTTKWL